MKGREIHVTWAIDDMLTGNLIRYGALMDLTDSLKAVHQTGVNYWT